MAEELKTHSIVLRLRRVNYEDAYVAVPVTDAIIKPSDDGKGSIDVEAFIAEAIRIGEDDAVEWKVEERHTEAHPIQTPVPRGRILFDGYSSEPKA